MAKILYLHGFNSSPASQKAQQTHAWLAERSLAEHFICPTLPSTPKAAAMLITQLMEQHGPEGITLFGSSLGGFLASWAAEKYGCRAVLINPAVRPAQLLHAYLGLQRNPYSGEEYLLEAHHMDELKALEPAAITAERYWLLLETGDETLNYRDALAYYKGCKQTVIEGGDHSFQHWEPMLPELIAWAGVVR
ncbi:YqiA/YcfP family alpha/beta fold hydrolase [Chitinimonas sp. PSY-7]|uniref:YqiA/YcfP family alpha/beta fold hydrolase n=1 Tax=Chitinimonas sp. PSY-7 TaxID=3459088 RepID=UPI00403FE14E